VLQQASDVITFKSIKSLFFKTPAVFLFGAFTLFTPYVELLNGRKVVTTSSFLWQKLTISIVFDTCLVMGWLALDKLILNEDLLDEMFLCFILCVVPKIACYFLSIVFALLLEHPPSHR